MKSMPYHILLDRLDIVLVLLERPVDIELLLQLLLLSLALDERVDLLVLASDSE